MPLPPGVCGLASLTRPVAFGLAGEVPGAVDRRSSRGVPSEGEKAGRLGLSCTAQETMPAASLNELAQVRSARSHLGPSGLPVARRLPSSTLVAPLKTAAELPTQGACGEARSTRSAGGLAEDA